MYTACPLQHVERPPETPRQKPLDRDPRTETLWTETTLDRDPLDRDPEIRLEATWDQRQRGPYGQTNASENITLPQTSFAGGNYVNI